MLARLRALKRAQHFIGVSEQPPGSNRGLSIDNWNRRAGAPLGTPWCAAFMFSMFDDVGCRLDVPRPAAVASWADWAYQHGYHVARPFRGDVVAFSWEGPDPHPHDHIGIVERVLALPWPRNGHRFYLRTVEGNTGDAVRRRWRWVDPSTVLFIRVPGD